MGDFGYFDENRILYIVDRKKDLIFYNNFTIFPSEIEKVIAEIDEVQQSCVVGIYDPKIETEMATAAVQLKSGSKLTEKYIIDYVAERLPEVRQLHGGVYFVDKIPISENGKILRRVAKNMILAMIQNNQI